MGLSQSQDAFPAPLVRISDVSYTYPTGVHALDDISLTFPKGSVTGIVGPSGCGKSTLLRIIANLLQPGSGQVTRCFTPDSGRHPLTMVFQEDTLLPWLNVKDNVGLYYTFRHASKKEWEPRVESLLRLVSLQGFAGAYPYQLSGGMRRRAAFVASVAAEPELVLLDEPFSSVDEPTRIGIHRDVLKIVHELEMTVIIVTHDLAEAISLSDQVTILSARPGRVVATHRMPFNRDRDVMELRNTSGFLQMYGELWHELSDQIRRAEV